MKTVSTIIKALVAAGIVATLTHMNSSAHAAAPVTVLTAANKTSLAGAATVTALVDAAKLIVNVATTTADKQQLAQEISAWVAVNKSTQAYAFLALFIPNYPSLNGNLIVAAAIQANPVLASELAKLMVGQGKDSAKAATNENPIKNSTN